MATYVFLLSENPEASSRETAAAFVRSMAHGVELRLERDRERLSTAERKDPDKVLVVKTLADVNRIVQEGDRKITVVFSSRNNRRSAADFKAAHPHVRVRLMTSTWDVAEEGVVVVDQAWNTDAKIEILAHQ
jgi:hypothetical protein